MTEPTEDERHAERHKAKDICGTIDDIRLEIRAYLPSSRAASLAMTKLQEAMFWLEYSAEDEN